MIDYEKLKLAHKLALKLTNHYLGIYVNNNVGNPFVIFSSRGYSMHEYDSIDDLITKLQELTQQKPKYEVGQEVWRLNDEYEPESFIIDEVDIDENDQGNYLYVDSNADWWNEQQIYPSRKALIDAQIEYWKSLKYPTIAESTQNTQDKIDSMKEHVKTYNKACLEVMNNHLKEQNIDVRFALKECEHESDGNSYMNTNIGIMKLESCRVIDDKGHRYKCTKCGEFYK